MSEKKCLYCKIEIFQKQTRNEITPSQKKPNKKWNYYKQKKNGKKINAK